MASLPRPVQPRIVARWRTRFLAAKLLLVFDPQGLDSARFVTLRKTVGVTAGAVVFLRNATAEAIVAGTPLHPHLQEAFQGQSAVILLDTDDPAALRWIDRAIVRQQLLAGGTFTETTLTLRALLWDGEPLTREAWSALVYPSLELETSGPLEIPDIVLRRLREPLPSGALIVDVAELRAIRETLRPTLDVASEGWRLRLIDPGPNRIQVIKAVRKVIGLDLRASKDLVDQAPTDIEVHAERLLEPLTASLIAAGATIVGGRSGMGWIPVEIASESLFSATPTLHLNPRWRLFAASYRSRNGGNGIICALPRHAPDPDPNAGSPLSPRRPLGTVRLMEAVGGDHSEISYLHAAILRREANEFAAYWHGISWWAHTFIDALPENTWTWKVAGVKSNVDFRPCVQRVGDSFVDVSFFTTDPVGAFALVYHRDRYRVGSYAPLNTISVVCATAPGGYVF